MHKSIFIIKNTYNKAINKLMSTNDKFDYALVNIAEGIQKLCKAHSACVRANMIEQQLKIEERIKQLYAKKEEIEKKRIEYVAKISYLEAQRDAMAACSKVGIGDLANVDGVINECDNYIKQLEAEIKTNEFLMTL